MPSSAAAPSEFVKLVAYVDELEGGPPPITLTILAKPKWQVGRLQWVLIRAYQQYLSKAYPEFAGAYTITQYHAFPPKPQWDEIDHVCDILEKPKGLVGPHIHILATVEETEKMGTATTASSPSLPEAGTFKSPKKRTLNDSAVENLHKKHSPQEKHTAPPSSGTLRRPTRPPSIGGASRKRKNAPRSDLYEVGDDSEVETSHEDDLSHSNRASKRARTDAAQTPERQTPSATPTSAQPRPPTVHCTPVIDSSRKARKSVEHEETGLARGLWTDRENELMLAEIIKNGADTPTATLKDTLFPGRTTEGIRKRRKKMQIDRAEEIIQGRRGLGLPLIKSPASSKTPAKVKGSNSKPTTISRTPAKPKAHAVPENAATSKTPAKPKTPMKFKTPTLTKTPARLKSTTPRSVPHRRRDLSPVVLIEVVDDPLQTQLEVRPGGAVRVKTPNSSQLNRLDTASTASIEPERTESTASIVPVPLCAETTPSHDSGFDELVAEEEQRQDSIEWLPQTDARLKIPRSYNKFLKDARAAASSNKSVDRSQLHQSLRSGTLQSDEFVSSVPVIPSSPSPNLDPKIPAKHGLFLGHEAPIKCADPAVPVQDDHILSSPEKIRSPSPDTAAAWVEVERSSSKVARPSPGWPEDTPIAKCAIANAEAREAVHSTSAKSITSQTSPVEHDRKGQWHDRQQSIETNEAEEFDTRNSGQTPRTLNFKARTPRSLVRPIASRRLPFPRHDTSSEIESHSSDGDDGDSSANQSDMDADIETKPVITGYSQTKAKDGADVDTNYDSEADSSDDDSESSNDDDGAEIEVNMADANADSKAPIDVKRDAGTRLEVSTKIGTDVNLIVEADVDCSESSSDSDSSDDASDAEITLDANTRVGAERQKDGVDLSENAVNKFNSSDGDDSDSSSDESVKDYEVDAEIKSSTTNLMADILTGVNVESDVEEYSDHSSNSNSSESSDSEIDDTEVSVRRNVSKALGALVDIGAKSDCNVSTVSSQESDSESSSSDESSDDEGDEHSVEHDVNESKADALADQQLRSDAEQNRKNHDDLPADSLSSREIAPPTSKLQEKAAETEDDSDSDSDSGSDSDNSSESLGEEVEEDEEESESEENCAPIIAAQPLKRKMASRPLPKELTGEEVPPKRSREEKVTKSSLTNETQPQTELAPGIIKAKETRSFDKKMRRKWLLLMGS
ncbi:hypothetical protein FKW77_001601 [Venturia effusa]|uniref:Uncharacterized protein n=1 Tax=Venturia effusa TaxID=50376 RepID=A0A517KVX2_9PEZI|nr:hypothetical protein FKW77_001601 [Venturia effusa]